MSFQDTALNGRRLQRLAVVVLGVGLLLRLCGYLGDPSIWWDEAAIMLNVEDKNFAELAGPLDYAQSGPPLFLWLEKGLVTALGDYPCVWRAPALVGSCLGLVLFAWAATRMIPVAAQVWAVGLFAFSDRLLWHTVEVKPYTIDTLAAIGMLAAWLWTDAWKPANRILMFTLLCPLLFCLSYPAFFIAAGPALVLLADAWRDRRFKTWLLYGLYVGAMGVTCAWLVLGPIRAQQEGLVSAGFTWQNQMPNWTRIDQACWWPLKAVFEVLRYCLYPTGGLLIGFAAGGAFWLIRNRQERPVAVMLIPLLAVIAAACFHRYPVGCARPMLFMSPAASLLIGSSIPPILRWCLNGGVFEAAQAKPLLWCRRCSAGLAGITVLVLVLSPMAFSLCRLAIPLPPRDCRGAADYVLTSRQPDDLVVITSWDQIYFYRQLDPRWQCGRDRPSASMSTRCWVTLGYPCYLAFERDQPPEKALIGLNDWSITTRKEFGELTVVLLERVGPGL